MNDGVFAFPDGRDNRDGDPHTAAGHGKSPCYGCTERAAGCHAGRGKYLSWKAEDKAKREAVKKNREGERIAQDFRRHAAVRAAAIKGKR